MVTSVPAFAQRQDSERLVDLTHSFDDETVYWPTEDGFKLIRESAGITEKGYYYAANRFMCAEHGGTHIDAPIHFFEKGQTVDKIALDRLIGPGACIDVTTKCAADRDYQVTVEDFEEWEADNKASLEKRIVLIRTGFGRGYHRIKSTHRRVHIPGEVRVAGRGRRRFLSRVAPSAPE